MIFIGIVVSLMSAATPLLAQAGVNFTGHSNWLAGYAVNAPQQLLGFGTWTVRADWGGWGGYVDAKFTVDAPDGITPAITRREAEQMGDVLFNRRSAWTSTNLAAVRALTPELALYLGGGASRQTRFLRYVDGTGERGDRGEYWLEDDDQPTLHPNVIGGAFFRMGRRIVFQFGAEAAPAGFTAGGHLLLR